jgi:hypothetical protein
MRFLKTLTLNRRAIYDDRVALTTTDSFTLATSNNMVLPNSENSIATPLIGMMRYNTSTEQVEVYQGDPATWRSLRFKESTGITQQTLGYGDASTVYFGPLNPAPPAIVESGKTWGGQNLLVIVENVIQLHNTNYTIVQNPTIPGQTYSGDISADTSSGSDLLTFDTSTAPIYPSVNIVGAALSGLNVPGTTTVVSYTVDSQGRLATVVMSNTAASTITASTVITITDSSNSGSGYFIQFSSAVPYSKPVTVLHGFDQ